MDTTGTTNTVIKPAIDLLMEAAQDVEGDYVMDDITLRDNLLTLISAGTETTATGMSWVLSYLGCYPEVGTAPPFRCCSLFKPSLPLPCSVSKHQSCSSDAWL